MEILIHSATQAEILPLLQMLRREWIEHSPFSFHSGQNKIDLILSGVGGVATSYALGRHFATHRPDIALQFGICGSFNASYPPGAVVHVIEETFGDLGAEDRYGDFLDLFDLDLAQKDSEPFHEGKLINAEANTYHFLPNVRGLSVNKAHGEENRINKAKVRFGADIESLEGAAFFYSCLQAGIPFLSIRAVSNFVEPRNRAQWDIPLAIDNLHKASLEILQLILE